MKVLSDGSIFYTTTEVSSMTGVSVGTLGNWAHSKKLVPAKTIGSWKYYSESQIQDINAGKIQQLKNQR